MKIIRNRNGVNKAEFGGKLTASPAILTMLFFLLLAMPIVFAKSKPVNRNHVCQVKTDTNLPEGSALELAYHQMHLDEMGLSMPVFEYAVRGHDNLVHEGKLENDEILSIADFSQPSYKKRLYVIDLNAQRVLFNTYVSHGVNSGKAYAEDFSNAPSSYKSSLGFYETGDTYTGGNGYSLKLEGLEKGFNDNAARRAIVVHGAAYVNEQLAKSQGYIGRSWGCPALPQNLAVPVINKIKGGSCLFVYGRDNTYLRYSKLLNS